MILFSTLLQPRGFRKARHELVVRRPAQRTRFNVAAATHSPQRLAGSWRATQGRSTTICTSLLFRTTPDCGKRLFTIESGRDGLNRQSARLISGALGYVRLGDSAWRKRRTTLDLDRNPANFQPLTPLGFLERAAAVFPAHTAIIHGPLRRSYGEFYARARRLASALAKRGIKRGDTVSAFLANTPAMLECHYGVPMCQGVLNTLNTRLDAAIIAFSLDHADAKVVITDREFSKVMKEALSLCKVKPLVIDYDDPEYSGAGERLGKIEYEDFVAQGDPDYAWKMPDDEWDAITLNYTSGTTGDPKGVVYHHRGAHLLAVGNVVTCSMAKHPVYLWTLPMFHCNGWCFPWSISVAAGTHVCLRAVRAPAMYDAIADAQSDASVRRADRDGDAAQRARDRKKAAAARRRILHRRRAAARSRARRHERSRLQRHASLWADRILRAGGRQRLAHRLEHTARRRTGGEKSAPGRALRRA